MNKSQIAAVFLTGAAAGVGGAKLTQTTEPAPQIRVHGLDLRAGARLTDGGYEVLRRAYGTATRADGGVKDIGQAKACSSSPARQDSLAAELRAAATECSWDL